MEFKKHVHMYDRMVAKIDKLHERQAEIVNMEKNETSKMSLKVIDDHLIKSSKDMKNVISMINNDKDKQTINLQMSYLGVLVENAISCAKHLQQDDELSGKVQKLFGDMTGEIKALHKNLKKMYDPIY